MGDWGFDDFKKYLKFQLGQRTDYEAATDDAENLYGVWVNLAYRELTTARKILGQEYNFRFPQIETSTDKTTTDGTAYIDVPTGATYIHDIFDETNNRWLEPIPWREYVKYTDRDDTNAEGDPTQWVRRGSYIYLHPTPGTTDDTIRVYHGKVVDNLEGTGVTSIGAEWDEIILQIALLKGLRWTNEYESLDTEAKALSLMLDQMIGLYKKEELGRNMFVHPSPTYIHRSGGYKK